LIYHLYGSATDPREAEEIKLIVKTLEELGLDKVTLHEPRADLYALAEVDRRLTEKMNGRRPSRTMHHLMHRLSTASIVAVMANGFHCQIIAPESTDEESRLGITCHRLKDLAKRRAKCEAELAELMANMDPRTPATVLGG
jgi:hypothetical protein